MTGYSLFIILFLLGIILWLLKRQKKDLSDVIPPKARTGCRGRFNSLQWRMTFSYVWITIVSILLILGGLTVVINAVVSFVAKPVPATDNVALVQAVARHYANEVAQQAQGGALGNVFPYPLGERIQEGSAYYNDATYSDNLLKNEDAVPYLRALYPADEPVSFALLVAPDMRVLSSSYPARYAPGANASSLLPAQTQFFQNALRGSAQNGTFASVPGTMIYASATVWSKAGQPVGAIYVQVPLATLYINQTLWQTLQSSLEQILLIVLVLFLPLVPLGGIFGFISTRGLVKRLKRLAAATTIVADGDYGQRLRVASRDEVGQLEAQFNRMAEQLGESVARQKELAEQNARLAERSRISRELHDAISQDLFSLSLLAGGLQNALPADSPLQHQAATLEQTTTNTIREMRSLLLELRPTNLEQLSLNEALEELASAYRTRLNIAVETHLTAMCLEARLEHAILRIAQEGFSNAARHANATEIVLTLAPAAGKVNLSLKDNGQGFHTNDESLRHGLGLRLMQERVQELGGTLRLISAAGQGTLLEICLPLDTEEEK